LGIFLNGLFDFDTEFEAEFIELFKSVLVAHEFIKAILLNFKVWHFFELIDLLLYFSVDIIKTILSLFKLFPLILISIYHQIMQSNFSLYHHLSISTIFHHLQLSLKSPD
jgi:hypothetical protein